MESLIYPLHYRIAQREGNTWHFRKISIFYSSRDKPIDPNDIKALYGMSWEQLAIAFFRINGGRAGWYLANLRDREYFYCGEAEEAIKTKLQELGIGKPDPIRD